MGHFWDTKNSAREETALCTLLPGFSTMNHRTTATFSTPVKSTIGLAFDCWGFTPLPSPFR